MHYGCGQLFNPRLVIIFVTGGGGTTHLSLTAPLSTQVYDWVLESLLFKGNLWMYQHTFQGEMKYSL